MLIKKGQCIHVPLFSLQSIILLYIKCNCDDTMQFIEQGLHVKTVEITDWHQGENNKNISSVLRNDISISIDTTIMWITVIL